MNILVVAQVEDKTNLLKQIAKQTVQPDDVFIYVDDSPAKGIQERRKRISENHEILRQAVIEREPFLVWQLEQDVDLEPDYLERLIQSYIQTARLDPDFGYISGIQVGRHGLYHLGAWHIGDETFESLDYKSTGVQLVDATGMYCLLAPADVWLKGKCRWSGEAWGPDVNFGLSLNKNIYVDMNLPVGHIIKRGIIHPAHASTCNVKFYKDGERWVYKTFD